MLRKKVVIFFVLIIVLVGFAWYLFSPLFIVKEVNEDLPPISGSREVVSQANLLPSAHDVRGLVKLIRESESGDYIRFEDFETVNGPDLYIYLATDISASDYVDLGRIKATKGNVNYDIPDGTDLEKYDTVLVWCDAFSVLFSYAELN